MRVEFLKTQLLWIEIVYRTLFLPVRSNYSFKKFRRSATKIFIKLKGFRLRYYLLQFGAQIRSDFKNKNTIQKVNIVAIIAIFTTVPSYDEFFVVILQLYWVLVAFCLQTESLSKYRI